MGYELITADRLITFAQQELRRSSLMIDLGRMVSQSFLFGDSQYFIIGRIDSVGFSERDGTMLYVSAKRFRGIEIRRFVREKDDWIAEGMSGEKRYGTLVLL